MTRSFSQTTASHTSDKPESSDLTDRATQSDNGETKLELLFDTLEERTAALNQTRQMVSQRDQTVAALRREIQALRSSTSWRITAPFRWVVGCFKFGKSNASEVSSKAGRLARLTRNATAIGGGPVGAMRKAMGLYRQGGIAAVTDGLRRVNAIGPNTSAATLATAPQGAANRHFDEQASQAWVDKLRSDSASKRVAKQNLVVSIIMPTKNRAATLPAAIASVQAQTWENWELLIIDDSSTDETDQVLEPLRSDPRIITLDCVGAGVCDARNTGLREASGDMIAYLDSDNRWMPNYLELMLCDLERSGKDTGYAVLKCANSFNGSQPQDIFYRQVPFDYERLRFANFIDLNVFVHRKSVLEQLGSFDGSLKRMVDWDLILRYTKADSPVMANFVGALYDNSASKDRITNSEAVSWQNVIRNKHWIDWEEEVQQAQNRDPNLISIVMCIYGQYALTEQSVRSIFTHQAGEKFELILVDNGSEPETVEKLRQWTGKGFPIKLICNPENFNFAFGNNIGFAASRGSRVVFLNNDTEVTPEWLRSLVKPLNEPEVMGTQPKLLYPDGTIQGAGVVFSDRSAVAYPIYVNQPGDFEPTQQPRDFAAITAACVAYRAETFARAKGFDPIYVNGQEDIDLCLRVGQGKKVFRVVPDSVVFHHEGKSVGRGKHIEANRKLFVERWADKIVADDADYYAQDSNQPVSYKIDNPAFAQTNYAGYQPVFSAAPAQPTRDITTEPTLAIKIGCPRAALKDHWGDYHFAVALSAAFARQGVRARIDFLDAWYGAGENNDVNLVLRGLSQYQPIPGTTNLMWMISHPDKVTREELETYDQIFVASSVWAHELEKTVTTRISTLLQCTDVCRFHPSNYNPALRTDALFVANSRKVLRPIVRDAIEQDLPISIYGEMWENLAPADWVKGEKIDNVDLPAYYASAHVVLNDHWDSMRERGFVSNRVFDVLASGASLVTDPVLGLPEELKPGCHLFTDSNPLSSAVNSARRDPADRSELSLQLSRLVRRNHSFDARAKEILGAIEQLSSSTPMTRNVVAQTTDSQTAQAA